MATESVSLGIVHVGNVDVLRLTFTKDGVAWSGLDSVTVRFHPPDGSAAFDRSFVVDNDTLGRWKYTTTTTDVLVLGTWPLSVHTVDGSVTKDYTGEVTFTAVDRR